jgi:type I restriction enzyme S subunit
MRSFDISDAVFIDEVTHHKMKRTWVKRNDVLLNITGASIGRIAVYKGEDDCANVNQHVCIIRVLNDLIKPDFLMFMISTDIFQRNIIGKSAGGTRESFTFEQIKNFDIISPPVELQAMFTEIVKNISNQLSLGSSCCIHSEQTFSALMSEYFS